MGRRPGDVWVDHERRVKEERGWGINREQDYGRRGKEEMNR